MRTIEPSAQAHQINVENTSVETITFGGDGCRIPSSANRANGGAHLGAQQEAVHLVEVSDVPIDFLVSARPKVHASEGVE
jgi:hypothetical protein